MPYATKRRALACAQRGALALAFLVFLAGCDAIGGGDDDDDRNPLDGLWDLEGQGVAYFDIDIGDDEIIVYEYVGDADCYSTGMIEILDVDDDVYTILIEDENGGGQQGDVRLDLNNAGDRLTFEVVGAQGLLRFDRSDDDASDLRPSCNGDDDDDDDDGGGLFGLRGSSGKGLLGALR